MKTLLIQGLKHNSDPGRTLRKPGLKIRKNTNRKIRGCTLGWDGNRLSVAELLNLGATNLGARQSVSIATAIYYLNFRLVKSYKMCKETGNM